MNNIKQNNLVAIQDLLEYIDDLRQEQSNLQNQYKDLSANHIHIDFKKKGFLDMIVPNRYKKFEKAYIDSQRKERKIKKIDETILWLQIEIEENQNFLYKLQHELAKSNPSYQDTIDKNTNNIDIEPTIN